MNKTGADVSARREEWSSGWKERYVVGAAGNELPSMTALQNEAIESWREPGERVNIQGKLFIVRAFEEIV